MNCVSCGSSGREIHWSGAAFLAVCLDCHLTAYQATEKEKQMPVPDTYKPSDTAPESKNLRAEDFPLDTKWTLTIKDVNLEELDGRKKIVLTFVDKSKGLILNVTNRVFLEQRLGEHPNGWIGGVVDLHRTTTQYEGKTVAAFRFVGAHKGTAPAASPVPF